MATAGKDRTIKIWKLIFYKDFKNSCLEKLILDLNIQDAHNSDVTALKACQQHTDILISGACNGQLKFWDINNGNCIKSITNYSGWVYKILLFERPYDDSSYQAAIQQMQK